jgi:hypothetical protein
MKSINSILRFLKTNKNKILTLKFLVLIIVNTWLLIIFWKTLLINNVNLIGRLSLKYIKKIQYY